MYFYKLNNSTAKYLPKISGEIFPCRDLYEMDYGSCIHHTQPNLETTQVSFSRWMYKTTMVRPFSGVLPSSKKYNNLDESKMHYLGEV